MLCIRLINFLTLNASISWFGSVTLFSGDGCLFKKYTSHPCWSNKQAICMAISANCLSSSHRVARSRVLAELSGESCKTVFIEPESSKTNTILKPTICCKRPAYSSDISNLRTIWRNFSSRFRFLKGSRLSARDSS